MPDKTLQKLPLQNLLHAIEASVDSRLFQHLYVKNQQGQEIDVAEGGQFSCAIMVSSILALQGLIDRPHATVTTTLNKMREAGWQETSTAKPAAVAQWPAHDGHEHIGFVLNETTCVSNSDTTLTPIRHPFTMRDGRQPIAYFWHPNLDNQV